MEKKLKCFNCKEQVDQELLRKVMQKGKVVLFCDSCWEGYLIKKEGCGEGVLTTSCGKI
ncbi:MAG: hypothetical protein NUV80_00890 [Candidatus Berkelbacteria bacterium]|nr:hypothetical protein [Candidatus Berkelbacteria bacterium]